jgi:hypothetical protein
MGEMKLNIFPHQPLRGSFRKIRSRKNVRRRISRYISDRFPREAFIFAAGRRDILASILSPFRYRPMGTSCLLLHRGIDEANTGHLLQVWVTFAPEAQSALLRFVIGGIHALQMPSVACTP